MPKLTLRDHTFRPAYGPGDDRLHTLYIPALSASTQYDRMTGYFSSHALAIAAAGVAHLIANGGWMRMLVGAQLNADDVAAIKAGRDMQAVVAGSMTRTLSNPEAIHNEHLRERLEALAWLVSIGRLDIRVVLPKGTDGLPIPAPEAYDYFHPKVAVFTDAQGNQVAFNGSINESANGWERNYECFYVFYSWESSRVYVAEAVGRFTRLWEQREPEWISMPVPKAARERLLRYTPTHAPIRDPLEKTTRKVQEAPAKKMVLATDLARERALCQYLRDAPHLIGASGLGAATCALTPWPHQNTVARRAIESYPARYLFCDEVGLGKTIEAGLVLRDLRLRGFIRRALILAPKSVLRQWQEELYEKFALNVPLYDGKVFRDIDGTPHPPPKANPWNDVTLALASSQLVKRKDRQQELLEARRWDLILVDEAHHARRKDFLDQTKYRPNRLLELLNQLQKRTEGLILMTATPMQVSPIEVWDLLNLLGLSGTWGVSAANFLRFYTHLRNAQLEQENDVDWDFLLRMVRAELSARGGDLDPDAVAHAQSTLGLVDWSRLQQALLGSPKRTANSSARLGKLPSAAQKVALEVIKHHTPLRRLVFRNTRPLLRDYQKRGLLNDTVPTRQPRLQWISMQDDERALYDRLDEYISNFYRKYEEKRKGLGFVMTVYRRRLTSSFYAVRRSLERRLKFLKGTSTEWALDEDDVEQDALSLDIDETYETAQDEARAYRAEEIAYVEDFVHALRTLSHHDSKVTQLFHDLRELFRQRDTVLIFTQYTDTMDFLRERLRAQYGGQVACYSGRGGEWWDGNTWVPITKEELKNEFRAGEHVKILLATDAASEGLNLQTCGVLINYDMPWNPMRVEQRIGRVDRIGQRYAEVWVRNYFYEDTVEALVYQALSTRIDWFQYVVGPLQPILAQVGRAIQTVAMTTGDARAQALSVELAEIESAMDTMQANLNLDTWATQAHHTEAWPAPVTLAEMQSVILNSPTLSKHLRPYESLAGAYWLNLDGQNTPVTFNRALFDQHPNTLHLLTYGTPLLEQLLAQVDTPPDTSSDKSAKVAGPVLRLSVDSPLKRVAYYTLGPQQQPQQLINLVEVRQALETDKTTVWTPEQITSAHAEVQATADAEWVRVRQAQQRLRQAQRETLIARTRRLVLKAALVELALGQQPELLTDRTYPAAFNEQAVSGLRYHGYPWAPLLKLVKDAVPTWKPSPTDPFYIDVQGADPAQLKQRFIHLTQQAKELLKELVEIQK